MNDTNSGYGKRVGGIAEQKQKQEKSKRRKKTFHKIVYRLKSRLPPTTRSTPTS